MSTVVRVTARQVNGSFRRRQKGLKKALQRAALRAAYRGREVLRKKTPVDQGQLKNSWRVRRPSGGYMAFIENDAPHAGIIELGARPHPVSLEGQKTIAEWVWRHRKSFVVSGPRQAIAGPRRKGQGGPLLRSLQPELMGIVQGIVQKIRTKGQRPTYFVRNSLPEIRDLLGVAVSVAVEAESKKPYTRRGTK